MSPKRRITSPSNGHPRKVTRRRKPWNELCDRQQKNIERERRNKMETSFYSPQQADDNIHFESSWSHSCPPSDYFPLQDSDANISTCTDSTAYDDFEILSSPPLSSPPLSLFIATRINILHSKLTLFRKKTTVILVPSRIS